MGSRPNDREPYVRVKEIRNVTDKARGFNENYSAVKRSWTISFTVSMQYTNVKDRRTDTGRRLVPRLRIASRGKKNVK